MLCNYSLPKPGFFFSEGRASFQKYSQSMKMSHTRIKLLIAFEGKGMSCGFWGAGGVINDFISRIGSISFRVLRAAGLLSSALLAALPLQTWPVLLP